ncbi:MAG: PIN domain-containing protein [Verrucomicrobia bacterium]|nr:PIN domain-containing protein [Verrucomicrobiota bacterium]
MNRAVFDTNVIVAGFLSPHGPPGRIVDWLRQGAVTTVLDDRIVYEYTEVLARPVFGLPQSDVALVLSVIRDHAEWAEAPVAVCATGLPDPDDAPFLECARSAGVPLVTGNTRHFPKRLCAGVEVLTPAEFVRQFE